MIGPVGNDAAGRPPLLGLGSAPGIGSSNHNALCVEPSLGHRLPVHFLLGDKSDGELDLYKGDTVV